MRTLLVAAATVLLLAGCGSDPDEASAPAPPPTSSPTPDDDSDGGDDGTDEPASAGPPCDVVTDADATAWAGTPQTVSGPQQVGAVEECITVVDRSDSLGLSWTLGEAEPLAALVEGENLDGALEEQDVELAGGTPAVLLTGEVVGEPFAQVVVSLDDRSLVVEARDTGLGDVRRSLEELGDVAVQVARAYTR